MYLSCVIIRVSGYLSRRWNLPQSLANSQAQALQWFQIVERVVLEDEIFKSGRHTTDFVAGRNIIQKVRERERILAKLESS
jgi:HD-like signal output (HDOD) protein